MGAGSFSCSVCILLSIFTTNLTWLAWKVSNMGIRRHSKDSRIFVYPPPPGGSLNELLRCYAEFSGEDAFQDGFYGIAHGYLPENMAEAFFSLQINQSALQTSDPSQATLFVIDTFAVLSRHVDQYGECQDTTHRRRQEMWLHMLKASPYLEQQRVHLFICQSYTCGDIVIPPLQDLLFSSSYSVRYLIHERKATWVMARDRIHLFNQTQILDRINLVPYVAHSFITTSSIPKFNRVVFLGNTARRDRAVRSQMKLIHLPPTQVDKFLFREVKNTRLLKNRTLNLVEYAQIMSTSNFCLCPKGDTSSSRRLFDAVMGGCLPVIVSDELELPFWEQIPYDDFVIRVPEAEWLKNATLVVQAVLATESAEVLRRQAVMAHYAGDLDWRRGFFVLLRILNESRIRVLLRT
eukprot:gb/GEZN01008359.1/.p1 GENE.gb/GEZN01008359.1/~~gb/GEZN01008359.1/.p1  ORF type:complete len:407 (+),score=35.89 gb/GEZN01008359.1/:46-1266(+)